MKINTGLNIEYYQGIICEPGTAELAYVIDILEQEGFNLPLREKRIVDCGRKVVAYVETSGDICLTNNVCSTDISAEDFLTNYDDAHSLDKALLLHLIG